VVSTSTEGGAAINASPPLRLHVESNKEEREKEKPVLSRRGEILLGDVTAKGRVYPVGASGKEPGK